MTPSISRLEHKKLLVRLFKKHLPGLKLSATSSTFAGGCAIDLRPKPGFTISDPDIVRSLYMACSATSYSRFNCMDDSTSYVRHQSSALNNGNPVMMGATFVVFQDNRDGVPVIVTTDQINAMLSDPEWPKVESGSVS